MRLTSLATSAGLLTLWGGLVSAQAPTGAPAVYVLAGTQHVAYRTGAGDIVVLYNQAGTAGGWKVATPTADAKAPKAVGDPGAYALANNLLLKSKDTEHVVYRG